MCVIGADPAQYRVIERAVASDPRITWVDAAAATSPDVIERDAALALAADWLVLPAARAQLHRHALAWCAASVGEGAIAFVTDEEEVSEDDGFVRRAAPQLRHVVDYDTLLEANPYGETIIVEQATFQLVAGALTSGSLTTARSSLLLPIWQAADHWAHPAAAGRPNGLGRRRSRKSGCVWHGSSG